MNSFQICKIDKDRSYRWICGAACVQGGGQRQSFSPSTRHPCLWRHVWGCGWTLHSWSCPSCRWEPPEIARPLLHLWSGHPWWSAALSNGPRGSHLGRGELRGELMIRALAEWNGICACVCVQDAYWPTRSLLIKAGKGIADDILGVCSIEPLSKHGKEHGEVNGPWCFAHHPLQIFIRRVLTWGRISSHASIAHLGINILLSDNKK